MGEDRQNPPDESLSVASIEGPWLDPDFDSGLIQRCRRYWTTPVRQLSDEMLATFMRQEFGLSVVVPEARRRIESGTSDGSELFDGELVEVLGRLRNTKPSASETSD
jgi:hypothetical protein